MIRIYSVGVWNVNNEYKRIAEKWLEFTPLEFETMKLRISTSFRRGIRIYSVGVWNQEI